jgi:hypothetical protein
VTLLLAFAGARPRFGLLAGDEVVDTGDEALEHRCELLALAWREDAEQMGHHMAAALGDVGVPATARLGDGGDHDPSVAVGLGAPGEAHVLEPLHGAGGRRRVDAQCVGEVAHPPAGLLGEQVEGVHLPLFERVITTAEQVLAQPTHGGPASDLDPRETDPHREVELVWVVQVDRVLAGHERATVVAMSADRARGDDSDGAGTPLDALGVLASADVMLTPTLRHVELYTMRGLLTVLWHEPPADVEAAPAALVLCGGAMGGLLGPADSLYHRLGVEWSARGVPVLRVSYRRPNDLELCSLDAAATVQLATAGGGAERVVVMGHSFGGAVAVRVGVGLHPLVTGVVTFATQSAGCEVAAGLQGTPLLLFHGDRDEILPFEASAVVQAIAGSGELVPLPGDGHLLAHSADAIWERLEVWLPGPLGR